MKYIWKAYSDDGCFEDKSSKEFYTRKSAYEDMRNHALEKMKWNTEWEDLDDNDDSLGYEAHFAKDKIVHESYSGVYTYEIIELPDVHLYGKTWETLDSYVPIEDIDWEVIAFEGIGNLWMNNDEGYMVLIEPTGRILKRYF